MPVITHTDALRDAAHVRDAWREAVQVEERIARAPLSVSAMAMGHALGPEMLCLKVLLAPSTNRTQTEGSAPTSAHAHTHHRPLTMMALMLPILPMPTPKLMMMVVADAVRIPSRRLHGVLRVHFCVYKLRDRRARARARTALDIIWLRVRGVPPLVRGIMCDLYACVCICVLKSAYDAVWNLMRQPSPCTHIVVRRLARVCIATPLCSPVCFLWVNCTTSNSDGEQECERVADKWRAGHFAYTFRPDHRLIEAYFVQYIIK